jgi:uncharacterized membrane protein
MVRLILIAASFHLPIRYASILKLIEPLVYHFHIFLTAEKIRAFVMAAKKQNVGLPLRFSFAAILSDDVTFFSTWVAVKQACMS